MENTKNKKVRRIFTSEDYEMFKRYNAYLMTEYGWLIPYLFLKTGKNNENKENKESNKQSGDVK